MAAATATSEGENRQRRLGMFGLLLGLAAGGWVLRAVAGPPRLPSELPAVDAVPGVLLGTDVPLGLLAYLLTTAAWALWFWLVATVALRVLVLAADAGTRGARWVRSLRALSDRVTLPIVRRLVDGALVAALVVNLLGRTVSSAAAAGGGEVAAAAAGPGWAGVGESVGPSRPEADGAPPIIQYTVQPGDSLWVIAERFYGTGFEFPRLVAANVGHVMADGRLFTHAGVIQPGWRLAVPLPSKAVDTTADGVFYVVEAGDTLRGIAARLLGDEARWPELYQTNAGLAGLADGRTLVAPDLIWPGLRLRLPQPAAIGTPELAPSEPVTPSPPPPTEPDSSPTLLEPAPDASPPPDAPDPVVVPPPAHPNGTAQASPDGGVPPVAYGAAGLAAAAVAGGVTVLVRRRVRRSLREPPLRARTWARAGASGFAEAELARAFAHRLHGEEVELAQLVADEALRFFHERGLTAVSLLAASGARNAVTLTLDASLEDQAALLALSDQLGSRLGGASQAAPSTDHDVVLRISGLKMTALLGRPAERARPVAGLLPLGVLEQRETLYANWQALGHVLITGLPAGGTEIVLTSLVGALVARYRPDELRLCVVATERALPAQFRRLPHQWETVVDPADRAGVSAVLAEARAELTRRLRTGKEASAGEMLPPQPGPELVLVIGELTHLADDGTTLEILGAHGPAHGVRLLATTTRPELVGDDTLAHFTTRLALDTLDESQSVRLIGEPDAAHLMGGELLVRIDARQPVRLRGFRISTDHVDELVRLAREAYGDHPTGSATSLPRSGGSASGVAWPHGEEVARHEELPFPVSGPGSSPPERMPPDAVREAGGDEIRQPILDDFAPPVADDSCSSEQPLEDEHLPLSGSGDTVERTASIGDSEVSPASGAPVAIDRGALQVAPADEPQVERDSLQAEEHAPTDPMDATAGDASARPAATPLRIRCLGPFVVTSGGREISASTDKGGQYKAWELLAFLAVQPGGAAPRDKVLGAIWPATDEERGRKRMGLAMVRLRELLARQVPGLTSDIVRAERNGTCRLDMTMASSDVQQFLEQCRAARKQPPAEAKVSYQRALALYRGDVLSDRSYRWLDERDDGGMSLRERCREQHLLAMQRLARLHYQDGEVHLAVPLYKRLLKFEPTLEDVVRELFRCYQQLGDLGALIREERQFRQALRDAYRDPDDPDDDPELYQPEAETIAVFQEALAHLQKRGTGATGSGHGRAPDC
jgi:DNA-binding SARP family transcriptional activator/LysM repeat protein